MSIFYITDSFLISQTSLEIAPNSLYFSKKIFVTFPLTSPDLYVQ